jgi:hypothetical protein
MDLPHAAEVIVPRNKVQNYLLDLSHPIGADKARFFLHFGFRREEWSLLADAFQKHVLENPVAASSSDPDGQSSGRSFDDIRSILVDHNRGNASGNQGTKINPLACRGSIFQDQSFNPRPQKGRRQI